MFPLLAPKYMDGLAVNFGQRSTEYYCGVPPMPEFTDADLFTDYDRQRIRELNEWIERERRLDADELAAHSNH